MTATRNSRAALPSAILAVVAATLFAATCAVGLSPLLLAL